MRRSLKTSRFWKRLLSGVMTVVMLVTILPTAAFAAVGELLDLSPVQRSALLSALEEVYGEDAEAFYALLEQYGLIDENGNPITDEKIVMDGKEYTLEEISALLDDPATDLSTVVEVDGTYLTLEELKTIIEIEEYLAYVEANYFTKQELTDEQLTAFEALAAAWSQGKLVFRSPEARAAEKAPTGVVHDVEIRAKVDGTTLEVSLDKEQTVPVSFQWRVLGGSAGFAEGATLSGEGTIPIESTDPVTIDLPTPVDEGRIDGDSTYVVQVYGVENALFSGNKTWWEQTVTVERDDNVKYSGQVTQPFQDPDGPVFYAKYNDWGEDLPDAEEGDHAIYDRSYDGKLYTGATAELTVSGLVDGKYEAKVEVSDLTFARRDTEGRIVANLYTVWEYAQAILDGKHTAYTGHSVGHNHYYADKDKPGVYWERDTLCYNVLFNEDPYYAELATIDTSGWINDEKSAGSTQRPEKEYIFEGTSQTYQIDVASEVVLCRNGAYIGNKGPDHGYAYFFPIVNGEATLTVQETTTSATVSFSAPEGTFYPGQHIPITAEFSFPMQITGDMTIYVNGDPVEPQETNTTGTRCTYLYTVPLGGSAVTLTSVSFLGNEAGNKPTGANDRKITVTLAEGGVQPGGDFACTMTQEARNIFTSAQATIVPDEDTRENTLRVTVKASDNQVYQDLLNSIGGASALEMVASHSQKDESGAFIRTKFQQDGESGDIFAELPLPNTLDGVSGYVEFYLDGQFLLGLITPYSLAAITPVTSGDMTPKLTITPPGEGQTGTEYGPDSADIPLLYAEQGDRLSLNFTLAEKDYTYGNTKSVTGYGEDGQPINKNAHFAWKSSDPSIARVEVSADGTATIIPTGLAGEVSFTLEALNGGLQKAESAAITVKFAVGADPFLMIPGDALFSIQQGQDAVVSWSSNLCAKNLEGGFKPTTFTITAYKGKLDYDKLAEDARFATYTATTEDTEAGRTISSYTIPWSALEEIYDGGARAITVVVTAEYEGKTYGGKTATAVFSMVSQPATIALREPDGGLYQTDDGNGKTIDLTWDLANLESQGENMGEFELYVASTNQNFNNGQPLSVTDLDDVVGMGGGTYSYSLAVPTVALSPNDPSSYRDSYTISVKVKNAADEKWAYSSYVLYVYSEDALKIVLDGVEQADGASHTMSNVDMIREKWNQGGEEGSQAIVALKRDIALKNVISVNYGDYAWAELADQIAWESSNSKAATINYQQGTLYENIENFGMPSYRPSTDFILSGLTDGETTVTATHAKTGQTLSLDVTVQTLKDQLYLFQLYPKQETVLTYTIYTDASRAKTEQKVLKTNGEGAAAIYAPFGLAGDVYCKSVSTEGDEDVTYLGTIYNRDLLSSEADSTKLQLYPVNTLQLRRAAQAEIFLKNADGTPYANKTVTFRGGVYRNGVYCENVQFGLQTEERKAWQTSESDHTATTDANGRLLVTMDLSQFLTDQDKDPVEAGEKLYYMFLLKHGDQDDTSHFPLMLRVDATLNMEDIAATGDSIVAWESNEAGKAVPFVSQQTIQYKDSPTASVGDVRKSTGSIGPSDTFPNAYLSSTVMWWGDAPQGERSAMIRDGSGREPASQTSVTEQYPWADELFTFNKLTMSESSLKAWGIAQGESRTLETVLRRDGAVSGTLALPFKVVNMIGVEQAEDSQTLQDNLDDIQDNLTASMGDMKMDGIDALILAGMKAVAGDTKYDASQETFAVRLTATSDPTVFRAFFCLNAGNMENDENVTGVYPDYTDAENMVFAEAGTIEGDKDLLPSAMDIYKVAKGEYGKGVAEDLDDALNGKGDRGFSADLGGYFEADIAYNAETGTWECIPITGGFHVGGGMSYTWVVNMLVGPVPVNISLTLGGTMEISMDMQRGHYYHVTSGLDALKSATTEDAFNAALAQAEYTQRSGSDYLTKLRVFLYIRVFAGIGFDLSVVAFKVGVFGQLNGDLNFEWLNRSYLDDSGTISAAGPYDASRYDDVMNGQYLGFSGSTGIEFVFKFLFISYEKIFCSVGFSTGKALNDWETIEEIWQANKTINNEKVQRMVMPNGEVMYAFDMGAQLESRDYVDVSWQSWVGGLPTNTLDLDGDQKVVEALQTGAYLYANPVLSDDGEVMFYLSDRGNGAYADAKDVTNTRVAVSTKQDSVFQEGTRFDDDTSVPVGYGDSNVKVAGNGEGYAAVWVRQMEDYTPAGGDGGTLDSSQQMFQLNTTEIMAAFSENGKDWDVTRLTENGSPDLAPVVATNGSRTVVAWREVRSASGDNVTSFDQQDAIRFAVYDSKSGWTRSGDSENTLIQTIYDCTGTGASIKGIEAAMLDDGTTAVVYTLDTDSANNSNTDWETFMALIPADGEESGVRNFRLTTDSDLDENPQITTVEFGNEEHFLAAWHTERAIAGSETESDIRLAAMNKDGVFYEAMPESLGRATDGTGEIVGSNFRFAKNAGSIEDLAILWVDSVGPETADDKAYEDIKDAVSSGNMGHDVLKAVKFVEDDNTFTVSGTVEVAEMEQKVLIDHFDAYMDGEEIRSVILGTSYAETIEKEVEISDGTEKGTYTAAVEVANPSSGMYTASETFTNRIEMPAVMLDYKDIYPNSEVDVQFTIRNSGNDPITKLEIMAGDETVYTSGNTDLNLLPNRDITVTARIPTGETIQNVDYTIKATFGGGNAFLRLFSGDEAVTLTDTLHLDIPDVGISSMQTVKEADGERTLRYSLYNALSASLVNGDDGQNKWQVKVGFYADPGYTKPLVDGSGEAITTWPEEVTEEYLSENAITISDKDALALIDKGGYSDEVTLPVAQYVKKGDQQGEIPATGITIYAKAWVETLESDQAMTRNGGAYAEITEPISGNNARTYKLESLAERRGEPVTVTYDMNADGGKNITVEVDAQYNYITGTQSGNLIVTLLDANGNPIAKQQSYTKENGLLTLANEGRKSQTFTFEGVANADSVRVEFSNLILDGNSVELDHISVAGIKADFDPATKTYTVNGTGLTSGALEIAPKDPKNAKITLNGAAYDANAVAAPIGLSYGETKWTITVFNNGASDTYTLVLNNTDTREPGGGGGSGGSGSSNISHTIDVPEDTEHGTVTVSPEKAKNGQTVTIITKPDEGYQVGKVTVTDKSGNTIKVTNKGDGVYTFTMPNSDVEVEVTFVPEGQWTNPFVDVPEDAWYYDAVRYVNEKGLMAGTSANTFAPGLTTTRGMIVTILYRLEGSPNIENEIWGYPFKDVDANAYYATAVYWARMNGIVAGYSDELFGPNDTITREQMATILYRYAQYKGYGTEAKADLSKYTDAAQVGSYAVDAIRWANAEGLVNGTSATTLTPKGSATRAQAAVILTRFCQNIAK